MGQPQQALAASLGAPLGLRQWAGLGARQQHPGTALPRPTGRRGLQCSAAAAARFSGTPDGAGRAPQQPPAALASPGVAAHASYVVPAVKALPQLPPVREQLAELQCLLAELSCAATYRDKVRRAGGVDCWRE